MSTQKATEKNESLQQNLKLFNQSFFDVHDPADLVGVRQSQFSISQIYELDQQRSEAICEELYLHVYEKLKDGAVGRISLQHLDYLDYQRQKEEPARKYIVIERETNRGTKMNVLIRFLTIGNNLYVAVDSYVIGTLDIIGLVVRIILTVIPLGFVTFYLSMVAWISSISYRRDSSLSDASSIFCCLAPVLLFVIFLWVDVVRAYRQHGNLNLALRQNLNVIRESQSFDRDDVLMFFKSSLPLVIVSVKEVLENNKLPVVTLDNFVANVSEVVNIFSGGGPLSIINSVIGGKGSSVSS